MHSVQISFIIPLYNKEKYIEACLWSLLHQNINCDNYEIIVINDGSTDQSLQNANRIARFHPNIIILDKKNSGTGLTRNVGLKVAKGKFISFIDADDYIQKNSYSKIIDLMEDNVLDVLMLNQACHVDEDGCFVKDDSRSVLGRSIIRNNKKIWQGKKFLEKSTFNDGVVCTIFRNDFLKEHHIKFEQRNVYEDVEFLLKAIFYANRFMSVNWSVYYVRLTNNSTTRHNSTLKNNKAIEDITNVLATMQIFCETKLSYSKTAQKLFKQKINNGTITLLNYFSKTTTKIADAKKFLHTLEVKGIYPLTFNFYKGFSLKNKIAYFVTYHKKKYLKKFK